MNVTEQMPFKMAARTLLEEVGEPLHYREITDRALQKQMIATEGRTPAATMNAQLAADILKRGPSSTFVRVQPGVFGLRSWLAEGNVTELPEREARVRVPYYPIYEKVHLVLPIFDGVKRQLATSLQSVIFAQRGTPQQNVDWSAPDTWIDEKLEGEYCELAHAIWEGTQRKLNPRHLRGAWLLVTNYELLADSSLGTLELTDRGRDFIENPEGVVVQEIDESEGLLKLLSIVVELGPATRGDLLVPFSQYLAQVSNVKADSSIKSYLWARLRNLTARGLVDRSSQSYKITEAGLSYLDKADFDDEEDTDEDQKLRRLISDHNQEFRELRDMDPFAFEHLIKSLLEAMGYEDVEVTSPSGDGGVDVIGHIELGITDVKEVVQVKRHANNIQRHTLDALRGSLHRFQAVRGTIISTSDYARGTREAAFEPGAAPITLINGEKLIDLLIEHRIGVHKKTVELLELDLSAFTREDDTHE